MGDIVAEIGGQSVRGLPFDRVTAILGASWTRGLVWQCSVMQCVAVCCSVSRHGYSRRVLDKRSCAAVSCVAVYCSVLQCVPVCCSALYRVTAILGASWTRIYAEPPKISGIYLCILF